MMTYGFSGESSNMYKAERLDETLESVDLMHKRGVPVSRYLVYPLLEGCTKKKNLAAGKRVHLLMVSNGLDSVGVLVDHLIRLFTMSRSLLEANLAFCKVTKPSVYTWHAIISAHVTHGESDRALDLYNKMQRKGVEPNKFVYMSVLKACGKIGALQEGKLIHDGIIRNRLEPDVVIGNTLIDMYSKCNGLDAARKVFDELSNRDIVSWGAMIGAYAQHRHGLLALQLFEEMQREGTKPNKVMLLCTLRACGSIEAIWQGELIHGEIARNGLESETVIGTTLVDMYAKCGHLQEAQKVFNNLAHQNIVSWGALIGGYTQHGHGLLALHFFERMQKEGTRPNEFIFSCIVKACGSIGDIGQGKLVHEQIIISGMESDDVIGNTLVGMYANCGNLEMAQKVFDKLMSPTVVSWGTMISAYVQHGHVFETLALFKEMQQAGLKPNMVTFSCILKACGTVGAIEHGKLVHDQIMRSGLKLDVVVGSTLIDMYSKCGHLEDARIVLEKLPNRNAVSWGAMIAGYAQHGNYKLAGEYLKHMLQQGFDLNGKIHTSILVACSHAAEIEGGFQYFESITKDHGIVPVSEHLHGMVDLLGRAGHLAEAEELLRSMPISDDITGWISLLSACKTHGNVDLGRQCFDHLVFWDRDVAAAYVLVSHVYADAQLWECVRDIQGMKKSIGVMKQPGKAWIEDKINMQEFIGGDKTHRHHDVLHYKLMSLRRLMKVEGYVPSLNLVLEPILEKESEIV